MLKFFIGGKCLFQMWRCICITGGKQRGWGHSGGNTNLKKLGAVQRGFEPDRGENIPRGIFHRMEGVGLQGDAWREKGFTKECWGGFVYMWGRGGEKL